MQLKAPSPLIRFGLAPLVVAVAALLRWVLWPILGAEMPLLLLWPAVVFCAWQGGLGPGLLATFLSSLAGGVFFWLSRPASDITGLEIWAGLLTFFALGGLTSLGLERLHETRRQLQEEKRLLTAERDWLRAILNDMAGGIIVTGEDERVTFLNPVAADLTGWGREAALGKHVNEVFHIISEKTRQTIEKPVARVLREGKAVSPGSPALLVARDGTEKRIDELIVPLRSQEGHIVGAVVSFHDMSQRRPAGRDSFPGTGKYLEPGILSQVQLEPHPMSIRLRILVVENNRESAEELANLFQLQGHEVAIAYSGPEAVKQTAEWLPQLVVCDTGLPGMDGIAVARALRNNPETAKARLIAISANGADEDRQRCLQAGFDNYLTRPVDPQVLQTVIALQTLVGNTDNLTGRGKNTA